MLMALVLAFGGSHFVAVSPAWSQVRPGSLEEELFNSVRNKDLNGVRAALNAGANVFATDMLGNRAADVAVDLSQFDIAHYLLSVMDHRRAAQKQAAAQKPTVELVQPAAPVVPPVVRTAPPPVVAPPALTPPQPTGPNPFAVTTRPSAPPSSPPSTVVSLSKPQLRMAGAKPSTPAPAKPAPLATPPAEPQSTLYVKPTVAEVAPQSVYVAPSKPVAEPAPAPQPAPLTVPVPAVPVPVADPVPDVAAEPDPEQDQSWFSQMTSLFSSDDEPEPAPEPEPATTEVAAIAVPVPAKPVAPQPRPSNRSSLQLTSALMLGKAPPSKPEAKPASMHAPADWPCVNKGRWGIVCLEAVEWPIDIRAHFDTPNNTLYRGRKVMVGYEDGRADFFYAVFKSSSFKTLVEAFSQRLGSPDTAHNRQIKPFQKLLEINPVRAWYAIDPGTGREMILELSMFEDQSSTFPVMDEGAIKLTYSGEDSVFRYTSPMELQRFN